MKVVENTDMFLLPNSSLTDEQFWFRSMFYCPNCKYGDSGFALCEFHQRGKKLLFKGRSQNE